MITLSIDQEAAIEALLEFLNNAETEIAISGHGGTGKSFLVKYFLDRLPYTNTKRIYLTSTTNQAAAVLADASERQVKTVHRLFGLRIKNDYSTGEAYAVKTEKTTVIYNSIIVIDEASMINRSLLKIIREQTINCKIIFVGDKFQLAPIKENECPAFQDVKTIDLLTMHRQEANNTIIPFAQSFRDALTSNSFPAITSFPRNIEVVPSLDFKEGIDAFFSSPKSDTRFRVLTWTNSQVHKYNKYIRELKGHPKTFVKNELVLTNQPIFDPITKKTLHHTDQLIRITSITAGTQNDIDGNWIGLPSGINIFLADNSIEVNNLLKHSKKYKDWRLFYKIKETFADLRPIYASTIAKSQGSTFHTVFLDVNDIAKCTINSDIARMMYVGISRASDRVILRGELPKRLY